MPVLPTEQYFTLVKEALREKGEAFVRVTGSSMRPMLWHMKDGVMLTKPDAIRPGDVVLFDRQCGRYALHRVIRMNGDTFSMSGDHQWHVEHGLPMNQIIGKVKTVRRNGRDMESNNKLREMLRESAEISMDELEKVSGGNDDNKDVYDPPIQWRCPGCRQVFTISSEQETSKHATKCPANPYK